MTQRKEHIGKSKTEKDYYSRYIKNLDYEPTVDETIKFQESDDSKKDFSLAKSGNKRKISIKQKIVDHIEENIVGWVIGIIVVVLVFLMIDSKVDIRGIDTNIENIKEDVKDVKETQKEFEKKAHEQDLKIQDNQIRIETLSKKESNKK